MATDPLLAGGKGFPCPQCGHPFRLTAAQLLGADQFACASCGLVLTLDKQQSLPTLERLRAYEQAIEQIAATVPGQTGRAKPR